MSRIVSSIPGRLRVRDPALRRALPSEKLCAELAALAGVCAVTANIRAGSVVVHYDPEAVDVAGMEAAATSAAVVVLGGVAPPAAIASVAAWPGHRPSRRVRINRQAKRGMLISLATSLLLAAAGAKRWHAASGGLFVAFLAIHLFVHRHHLLR